MCLWGYKIGYLCKCLAGVFFFFLELTHSWINSSRDLCVISLITFALSCNCGFVHLTSGRRHIIACFQKRQRTTTKVLCSLDKPVSAFWQYPEYRRALSTKCPNAKATLFHSLLLPLNLKRILPLNLIFAPRMPCISVGKRTHNHLTVKVVGLVPALFHFYRFFCVRILKLYVLLQVCERRIFPMLPWQKHPIMVCIINTAVWFERSASGFNHS